MARTKLQVTTRYIPASNTRPSHINVRWPDNRMRSVSYNYAYSGVELHQAAVLDVFPDVDFDRSEEVGATGYRFWISWNTDLKGLFSS